MFTGGNILLVSNKATIRIILRSLLGIDGLFRYRLACPVGSVSMVEFTSSGPMLKALADRSHLTAGYDLYAALDRKLLIRLTKTHSGA